MPKHNTPDFSSRLAEIILSEKLLDEIIDLQMQSNGSIHSEIENLTEVIDFMTCIHLYKEEAINPERLLDCIAILGNNIKHFQKLKA